MSSHVSGSTTVTVPGTAPVTSVGGLLALPSNIGRFSQDHFEAIPEFGVRVGYQVTPPPPSLRITPIASAE